MFKSRIFPFNPFWLAGANHKITFWGPWTYFKLNVIFDFDLNIFSFVIFFGLAATTTTKAHLNFFPRWVFGHMVHE